MTPPPARFSGRSPGAIPVTAKDHDVTAYVGRNYGGLDSQHVGIPAFSQKDIPRGGSG